METDLLPDVAYHPGDYIAEELEARGMTQRELAKQMGRPSHVISEIVRGKRALTADLALDLADALEISAQTWLNLQTGYDLVIAIQRRKAAQSA